MLSLGADSPTGRFTRRSQIWRGRWIRRVAAACEVHGDKGTWTIVIYAAASREKCLCGCRMRSGERGVLFSRPHHVATLRWQPLNKKPGGAVKVRCRACLR